MRITGCLSAASPKAMAQSGPGKPWLGWVSRGTQEKRRPCESPVLQKLKRGLLFFDFVDRFTVNAKSRCRAGLEASNADLDAAAIAIAVVVGI